MKKFFKKIKLEFFYLRKAFFEYRQGWSYIYYKYIVAPQILKSNQVLEKPINQPDLSIHILTCHRDLVMTIWSLASFYFKTGISGELIIHNDGSLTETDKKYLKKFFPSAKVLETANFLRDYADKIDQYPILKKFRSTYTNFSFKKLVDPYFVSDKKFRLIVDSDLIWYGPPTEIKDQITDSSNKSLMQSNNSKIYVTFRDGTKIDDKFAGANAGIIFYVHNNFNLEKINSFLSKLNVDKPINLQFADQLGHAFCLDNLELLSSEVYPIAGKLHEKVVVRHYTSPRRPLFYIEGLKSLNLEEYGFSKRN